MSDYEQTRDAAGNVISQYEKMLRNLDDDDLAKRLRSSMWGQPLPSEAADRIEELEAKLAKAVAFIEDLKGHQWPLDVQASRILAELSSVSCANLRGQNDE